jgi:hypothetical protein
MGVLVSAFSDLVILFVLNVIYQRRSLELDQTPLKKEEEKRCLLLIIFNSDYKDVFKLN